MVGMHIILIGGKFERTKTSSAKFAFICSPLSLWSQPRKSSPLAVLQRHLWFGEEQKLECRDGTSRKWQERSFGLCGFLSPVQEHKSSCFCLFFSFPCLTATQWEQKYDLYLNVSFYCTGIMLPLGIEVPSSVLMDLGNHHVPYLKRFF